MSKSTSTTEQHNRSHLERLDDLIHEFLDELTWQARKHAKVGDLLKMIELRYKLMPDRSDQKQFWEMIDRIRKDRLPKAATHKRSSRTARVPKGKTK